MLLMPEKRGGGGGGEEIMDKLILYLIGKYITFLI